MFSDPSSVSDVAQDGIIHQRWIDDQITQHLGPISAIEANQLNGDNFQVRYGRRHASDLTFPATRVAVATEDGWTWTSPSMEQAAEAFGIAELWGTHPERPEFAGAARTIHGNAPLLRAGDNVLTVRMPLPEGSALLTAAGQGQRALAGYRATTGDTADVVLRDGLIYDLPAGMPLDDVRADSHFLSAEHQFLFEALVPAQAGVYNQQQATVSYQTPRGPLTASAQVVATVACDTWKWNPQQIGLRKFGRDKNIPVLCTPSLPVALAQAWNLERIAKPILGIWTHAFVPVSPDSYLIVLLQHPALQLPAPTPEVTQQVLAVPLAPELSRERAEGYYRQMRGIA